LEGNPGNPRDFHYPALTQLRMQECDKLHAYLKSIGQATDWWETVLAGKQDPWQKLRENDPHAQMRQFKLKQRTMS
jgi:hypothetical protein